MLHRLFPHKKKNSCCSSYIRHSLSRYCCWRKMWLLKSTRTQRAGEREGERGAVAVKEHFVMRGREDDSNYPGQNITRSAGCKQRWRMMTAGFVIHSATGSLGDVSGEGYGACLVLIMTEQKRQPLYVLGQRPDAVPLKTHQRAMLPRKTCYFITATTVVLIWGNPTYPILLPEASVKAH